jgi:two-component system CheB/CheR fusion protein
VAGIGASAGGLEAFSQMLGALPRTTGVAYVFVQHLDPTHESLLTEILAKSTPLPVQRIRNGMAVRPDVVHVAPPNCHVTMRRGVLRLKRVARGRAPQMPIDLFFRSLAEDQGSRAVGIVLSGTASDGTLGLRAIKAAGGLTFAQDEKSAKYAGMPHSAAAAGVVDFVLPPQDIARSMARVAGHPLAPRPVRMAGRASLEVAVGPEIPQIFALLKTSFGVDFGQYKPATIERRIARRMFLGRIDTLGEYFRRLKASRNELDALYHDLLINVTSFFREPELFDGLRRRVYHRLFRARSIDSPVRVWVPGCSTGEEAYSIAISMMEHLGDSPRNIPVQIFATDVSELTIERARAGRYPESIALDVSPERLRRFFTKADGGYQVSRGIRDLCVFARQDITRDPPLSRMDLISCRNLLIYLSPEAQKRVIPTLHYALVPQGVLILGTAESTAATASCSGWSTSGAASICAAAGRDASPTTSRRESRSWSGAARRRPPPPRRAAATCRPRPIAPRWPSTVRPVS